MNVIGDAICPTGVLSLLTALKHGDPNQLLIDFTTMMYQRHKSKIKHVPQVLTSQAIYFGMILRFNPKLETYINGTHFLYLMCAATQPYSTIFINSFLIPCLCLGLNFNAPASKHNSMNGDKKLEGYRVHKTLGQQLIESFKLDSDERTLVQEMIRLNGNSASYIFLKMQLPNLQQDLAMYLDKLDWLHHVMTEDEIGKAIVIHSNTILKKCEFSKPHFAIAVNGLNLEVAQQTYLNVDCVEQSLINDLIKSNKKLGQENQDCLELLKLVIAKNVTLCKHQWNKIPEAWRTELFCLYTVPRWKHDNLTKSTLNYYKTYLNCNHLEDDVFLKKLQTFNPDEFFVTRVMKSNEAFYRSNTETCLDNNDDAIQLHNHEDFDGNDILQIPRAFVYSYKCSNNIYLFTYPYFDMILKKNENPYNRKVLPDFVKKDIEDKIFVLNDLGLDKTITTIPEFIEEFKEGRKIRNHCNCVVRGKYKDKLSNLLSQYGVTDDSFNNVQFQDLLVKLSLVSIDLVADNVDEVYEPLYKFIKESSDIKRETIKSTVANIILMYNRIGGGIANFINNYDL